MIEHVGLLNKIAHLSQDVSPAVIQELCRELEKLQPNFSSGDVFRTTQSVHQPGIREILSEFLTYWKNNAQDVDPQKLAWALRAASVSNELNKQDQTLELVWTGPTPGTSTLRRTDQVLLDMIQTSKESLIIVTFAAYKIPRISTALVKAAERDVSIILILESPEESEGKVTFGALKALGKELVARSEVYVWPHEQRKVDANGHYGSLHAKCAIADRSSLLLSSANLTEYALDLNIEMGLLIRGGKLPEQAYEHFKNLISNRVLRKIGA